MSACLHLSVNFVTEMTRVNKNRALLIHVEFCIVISIVLYIISSFGGSEECIVLFAASKMNKHCVVFKTVLVILRLLYVPASTLLIHKPVYA